MLIHRARQRFPSFSLTLNDCQILRKTETKYLGIIIDHKLDWKPHINYVKNKISKCLWAIFKIRLYVDIGVLKLIYYALAYSHLQYGVSFWGAANRSALMPLIIKQKCIVRSILKMNYRAPSSPLFLQLQMLNIEQIYKLRIGILMHKTQSGTINIPCRLTKTSEVHSYNTRSTAYNNFYIPEARINLTKESLIYSGPKIWNNIPPEIRSLPFLPFKKKFKSHLLQMTT